MLQRRGGIVHRQAGTSQPAALIGISPRGERLVLRAPPDSSCNLEIPEGFFSDPGDPGVERIALLETSATKLNSGLVLTFTPFGISQVALSLGGGVSLTTAGGRSRVGIVGEVGRATAAAAMTSGGGVTGSGIAAAFSTSL